LSAAAVHQRLRLGQLPNRRPALEINEPHRWDLTFPEARTLQDRLRSRVRIESLGKPRLVAGADVALPPGAGDAVAGVVVMRLPSFEVVERRFAVAPLRFPYVPGYLSFREGEVVLAALRALESEPDLFLFDGQGICHPRRFGLASHLGVILDRPSVGCAKSLLCGSHAEPAVRRGSRRRIVLGGETVGMALRTRDAVRPVYVSIGHRAELMGAARAVLACCRGYRIPEPLRETHRWTGEVSRALRDVGGLSAPAVAPAR
jgi:deoxyribonuclease V